MFLAYDRLWDTIQATAPELFIAWRDCGLLDELGIAADAGRPPRVGTLPGRTTARTNKAHRD
jgi:hypothetical protein